MKTPRKNPEVFFFCMKAYLTFFVSALLSPLFFMFSVWRASGASLASSQEVDVNGRARLPSDERLASRDTVGLDQKLRAREKTLALKLNAFFFPAAFLLWRFPFSCVSFFHHMVEPCLLYFLFFF